MTHNIPTIALVMLVALGCGRSSQADDLKGPGVDGGLAESGGTGGLDSAGGATNTGGTGGKATLAEDSTGPMPMPLDAAPRQAASCDDEDERRNALPEEQADYCICTSLETRNDEGQEIRSLGWACYGPDPAAPATGQRPDSCEGFYFDQGDGGCLIIISQCSDGHSYMLSCIGGRCTCLVDNIRTAGLEPRGECQLVDFEPLCGWDLPVEFVEGGEAGG